MVRRNLQTSFPAKTEKEIIAIERNFFRHLTDIFVEGIKVFSMSHKEIVKRHKLVNSELLESYLANQQSLIVVTGHYGNWEWGALSAPLQVNMNFLALYKRIQNPHIDDFIKSNRSRAGTHLYNIKDTSIAFETFHNKSTAFLLAADQSPGLKHLDRSYWINFLNQDTPCLYGPEKYARKYNLPVIYLEILKVKRGYYELHLEDLVPNPSELQDGEITKLFMNRLEQTIIKAPEFWLWSHRRWKRKRT